MKEKNQAVPDEVLSKEFISQFKTEADVSKFLKQLHAQVLEKMLEGEMDDHLGYEKNSMAGNYTGERLAGWNNLKDSNGNPKTNRMYEIGDFTTVDFTIGYQFKKFNIQGRLGNIFDVVDYNVHENYSVNPITPRNFYLTFNYKL
jgi:hypothetical protein